MDMYSAIAGEKPLVPGSFRVVVSYGEGDVRTYDYTDKATATGFADDVASEWSEHPQIAVVFDSNFAQIHEGRPYYIK